MSMRRTLMGAVLAASVALAGSAAAQVKIGPKGVTVKDDDGNVTKVDAKGTTVESEDGDKVEVKNGVRTKAKKTKKKTKTDVTFSGAKHGKFHCDKTQNLKVEKKTADAPVGASASGSCDLLISKSAFTTKDFGVHASGSSDVKVFKSTITSKNAGLHASGSADVVIDGSTIKGPVAIHVSGSAKVVVKNSTIIGTIDKSGNGELVDGGGNQFKAYQ